MGKHYQIKPVPPVRRSDLMLPSEVAELFRVDPKTVSRWAKDGKLSYIRTLGGHRRYLRTEVRTLLAARSDPDLEPA